MLAFEISFADSRCTAISALAVSQLEGHLSSPSSPIRAQKVQGIVETSTNQGVAPTELSRMLIFEICFSDFLNGETSTLVTYQG